MILPLMLLVVVACQPATVELTDAEKAAIAEEVTAIHDQMWEAAVLDVSLKEFFKPFNEVVRPRASGAGSPGAVL
jgi:hypothetical protein